MENKSWLGKTGEGRVALRLFQQFKPNLAPRPRRVVKNLQWTFPRLRKPVGSPAICKTEGGCQQDELLDGRALRGKQRRQITAHAGSDQSNRVVSRSGPENLKLLRDGQMLKITAIQFWNGNLDAGRQQPFSKSLSFS